MRLILRVGLFGIGMMGRQHARVLSNLPGINFVGSFDTNPNKIDLLYGKPVFNDVEEILTKKLDYAVVATPTETHAHFARVLSNNGIHAMIEKPLSTDFESCLDIVRCFEKNGLIGAVGHIERFNPALREAKRRLDNIGHLYQISTRRQGPFPGRIKDVGVAVDLATHDIDLTSWITGQDFELVSASTVFSSGRDKEDMLIAIGNLSSGTISSHIVNWLSPFKDRSVLLTGSKGSFAVDTLLMDLTHHKNGSIKNNWDDVARFRGISEGDVIRYSFDKKEPLLSEHENFRDAILGLPNEIVTLLDGLKAITVAEAMIISAEMRSREKVRKVLLN